MSTTNRFFFRKKNRHAGKCLLGFLVLSGLTHQADAQLRDIMMKKAGEKMKKNQAEETNTTDSSKTAPAYNPFGSSGSKSDLRPAYSFTQNVLMEMKSYNKKGELKDKNTNYMRMHFGNNDYTGSENIDEKSKQKMFMIFEGDKKQMVMLMENDGQKIAHISKYDPSKYADQQADKNKDSQKTPTITKTGRTKKVCGYLCEEWVSTDDKGNKSEMWVSKDVPLKSNSLFSMFAGQKKDYTKMFGSDMPQGFMLEMTHYDTNGEKFTMTATEVNLNAPKTIETAGYTAY